MSVEALAIRDPDATDRRWLLLYCDYCSNRSRPCPYTEDGDHLIPEGGELHPVAFFGWGSSPHPSDYPLDWCPDCMRDLEENMVEDGW